MFEIMAQPEDSTWLMMELAVYACSIPEFYHSNTFEIGMHML